MKWTDDALEVGASKSGPICLGAGKFQTDEDIRQTVLAAQRGEEQNNTRFSEDAIERGNRLETPLAEWAADKLDRMCPTNVQCMLSFADDAHRLKDERMAASLDGMLLVSGGSLRLQNPFGDDFDVTDWGVLEIKTDAWDDGPPRHEQVIQLHHQMLCADMGWGVIAKLGPRLKFELWPYLRNDKLCQLIVEKVRDFWHRVDNDIAYPPKDDGKPEPLDFNNFETKDAMVQLIQDYLKCDAEESGWKQQKETIKQNIQSILDQHNAQSLIVNNYKVDWSLITRKAQPEKITPAKPSSEYRTFKIVEN